MKLLGLGNQDSSRSSEDKGASQSKYLVQAIALEENQSLYKLSRIMVLIAVLIIGLIIWSSFAVVPELSRANGEVVPIGRAHKVQHLEGGVVADILVRDGTIVDKGDILFTLEGTLLVAELSRLHSSKVDYQLRLERLGALLENRSPNFVALEDEYSILLSTHSSLYQEQIRAHQTRLLSYEKKIENRLVEIGSKGNQKLALTDEVSIYSQNSAMSQKLYDQKIVAKIDVLESSARLASTQNRLSEVEGELQRLDNSVKELRHEVEEYLSSRREQLTLEKTEAARNLTITKNQIDELDSRIHRLTLRSPVAGIVKGLTVNSINEVIRPGEVLMEIVPTGEELMVEAKVSPKDIGHVVKGLRAKVKVSSYDFQKFGGISGEIINVSASTHLEDDNTPYYLVEIRLDKNYVGNNPDENYILPGMVVQADIITGSKTVLEYILKPLRRGFEGAFSER